MTEPDHSCQYITAHVLGAKTVSPKCVKSVLNGLMLSLDDRVHI